MSLNIEISPISPADVKSVAGETVATASDTKTFSGDANGDNTAGNAWLVPGSVVVKVVDSGGDNPIHLTDDGNGKLTYKTLPATESPRTGQATSSGTVNYLTGAISLTYQANLAAGDTIKVDYRYFDEQNRYTAGAVPTTLRFRNNDETAGIIVLESDDGTNWLQVGAHQVQPWEIYNFDRVTQRQLLVASTSSGRLIGSPLSAI